MLAVPASCPEPHISAIALQAHHNAWKKATSFALVFSFRVKTCRF
jgi:hypothetical protein